jgi:hypothetical protein
VFRIRLKIFQPTRLQLVIPAQEPNQLLRDLVHAAMPLAKKLFKRVFRKG